MQQSCSLIGGAYFKGMGQKDFDFGASLSWVLKMDRLGKKADKIESSD